MRTFTAQIDNWGRHTRERMIAIVKESAQRMVSIMQTPVGAGGNMPIDTGFLRASVQASISGMPQINPQARPAPGTAPGSVPYNEGVVQLVIARMAIGDTLHVGYTAAYAQYQENRRGFVRLAAQQWPQIVVDVNRDLKRHVISADTLSIVRGRLDQIGGE